MQIRSLIGAALIVAMSSVAFAASTPATKPATPAVATKPVVKPADRCASLEQQFTDAAAKHKDAKNLADAQKLADAGTKLCTDKKYSSGERKLIAALKDLGEKAKL